MVGGISRYKFHLLIIAIGLLWLMIVTSVLQLNLQKFIFADAENYRESGEFLYHHHQLHHYRPVVMAAIYGIPYLFGFSDSAVYHFSFYVNLFCWIGTTLFLFALLKQFLADRKAFYVTLSFFLMIGCIIPIFQLLSESLYTFVIMAGFYLLSQFYRTNRFGWLSAALGIFLISMLVRPGAQYLALLLFLYFIPALFRNRYQPAMLFVAVGFLLVGLQLYGMKKQYGDYTISYISGVTAYNYLGAKSVGYHTHKPLRLVQQQRMDSIFRLDFHAQQAFGFTDLKKQIRDNPSDLAKAYLSDLADNTRTPSDGVTYCKNIKRDARFGDCKTGALLVTKWQNRLLTISGIVMALYFLIASYRREPFWSLAGFYILYTFLLSGFSFYQGDRFHIVFFPMVILLAAKFAVRKP